jgi:hypothetical protein
LVVVAAYASEWGTAGAAALACQVLQADCVLARDDGGTALPLAAALAQRRARALVVVRGTLRPLGADLLVLSSPEPAPPAPPAVVEPLLATLEGRLTWTRRAGDALGSLRAFPAGAGRLSPTVLLWLSPFARRVMSGADQLGFGRPEVLELAERRGLAQLRDDGARWLAAGRGAPPAPALERTEMLARTGDVAQLRPPGAGARLALLVDEAHGLTALALEDGPRRALVLGGERREERAVVGDAAAAEAALRRGVRTLVPAEGAP